MRQRREYSPRRTQGTRREGGQMVGLFRIHLRDLLRSSRLMVFVFVVVASAAAADRPNIVVILADDLGAVDLACYGADLHETPRLDGLAKEAVLFRQAYA